MSLPPNDDPIVFAFYAFALAAVFAIVGAVAEWITTRKE